MGPSDLTGENPRHSRGLRGRALASGRQFLWRSVPCWAGFGCRSLIAVAEIGSIANRDWFARHPGGYRRGNRRLPRTPRYQGKTGSLACFLPPLGHLSNRVRRLKAGASA